MGNILLSPTLPQRAPCKPAHCHPFYHSPIDSFPATITLWILFMCLFCCTCSCPSLEGKCQESTFLLFLPLFLWFYFFLERGEGREKERERNISVWLPLMWLPLGTWPINQACVLTGNPTGDPWFTAYAQSTEPHQPGPTFLFYTSLLQSCTQQYLSAYQLNEWMNKWVNEDSVLTLTVSGEGG